MIQPTMNGRPAGALTLVCSKCTRYGVFPGASRAEAEHNASTRGWVARNGKTICPKCPK